MFDILLLKKKAKYLRFLYLNYSCSQPQSLEKLIKDYNCLVFPYYTFQTYYPKTSTDDCCDIRVLVLDFVNFTLTFYNKNEIDKVFLIDTINEVDEGHLKDEIDLTTNNDVFSFNILIKSQKSLILHLISFMQKTQSDKAKDPTVKNKIVEKNLSLNFNYKLNFTNSTNRNLINPADESLNRLKYLNELKMLENELYMPCGYILKNEGYKVGKKTSLKKKRYLLLGTTNLLIFKYRVLLK